MQLTQTRLSNSVNSRIGICHMCIQVKLLTAHKEISNVTCAIATIWQSVVLVELKKPNYSQKLLTFNNGLACFNTALDHTQLLGMRNALSVITAEKMPNGLICLHSRERIPKHHVCTRAIKGLDTLPTGVHTLKSQVSIFAYSHSATLPGQQQADIGKYKISLALTPTIDAMRRLQALCHLKPTPKHARSTTIAEFGTSEICRQVQAELLAKRAFVRTGISGQVIMGPDLTCLYKLLVRVIERIVLFDFQEILVPKTVALATVNATGHLRKLGGEYLLVSEFKSRDTSKMAKLLNCGYVSGRVPDLTAHLKPATRILTYSQCMPFWEYVRGQTIDGFSYYDCSGPSYRNEGGGISGLQRLSEFHRIELIFSRGQLEFDKYLSELLARYKHLLKSLGLKCRIIRVPSWSDAHESTATTLDFQVWIPQKNKWLELANLSNNGHAYPRLFRVTHVGGERLIAGCSGIGLDRLVLAILSYHKSMQAAKTRLQQLACRN